MVICSGYGRKRIGIKNFKNQSITYTYTMKTKIIINKGWKFIKEYDFLITLSKYDIVEFNCIEYEVISCLLELENDTMIILVDN